MTRDRYRIYQGECPYFLTCTIVGWLAVFTRPETFQIIYDSWNWFCRQGRPGERERFCRSFETKKLGTKQTARIRFGRKAPIRRRFKATR